jgi:integrase/recombinase XerD
LLHPTLFPLDPFVEVEPIADKVREAFLMAYTGHTLTSYTHDLKMWFRWCEFRGVKPLDASRVDVESYMRELERDTMKDSTRQRRLVTIAGYYRYAEEEDFIIKSPAKNVRRPRVPNVSTSAYLDRFELARFLMAAESISPRHAALAVLLALNGLRVSEACGANIESLRFVSGHHLLTITRKGGFEADIPLPPRVFRCVRVAIGDREEGAILLDSYGKRMSRDAAARAVRLAAKRAGITKNIGPHACRHTFVSLGLDANIPLRDMQVAAGHANPETTVRYDRRDKNFDRAAAYVVAALVAA